MKLTLAHTHLASVAALSVALAYASTTAFACTGNLPFGPNVNTFGVDCGKILNAVGRWTGGCTGGLTTVTTPVYNRCVGGAPAGLTGCVPANVNLAISTVVSACVVNAAGTNCVPQAGAPVVNNVVQATTASAGQICPKPKPDGGAE